MYSTDSDVAEITSRLERRIAVMEQLQARGDEPFIRARLQLLLGGGFAAGFARGRASAGTGKLAKSALMFEKFIL